MGYKIMYNGTEYDTYAQKIGGRLYANVRASTQEAWETAALAFGLVYSEEAHGRGPDGQLKSAPNVEVVKLPPQVIVPAVLDEAGEVVSEAVVDTAICFNLMFSGSALSLPSIGIFPELSKVDEVALYWTLWGSPDPKQNNTEEGKIMLNVSLLKINGTPNLIWAN